MHPSVPPLHAPINDDRLLSCSSAASSAKTVSVPPTQLPPLKSVCGADIVPPRLLALQHHRPPAVHTIALARQRIDSTGLLLSPGSPSRHQCLNRIEHILTDDSLMGVWHNIPLLPRNLHHLFVHIADLPANTLHHMTKVHLIDQNPLQCLSPPEP